MERRPEPAASPWRVLGEPAPPPSEPAPTGASLPLPLLAAGVVATIVVAALAFVVAATSTGSSSVGVEGLGSSADGGTGDAGSGAFASPSGPSPGPAVLVVDVGGAVARPGVYRLPAGSRVGDAIAEAGGFGPRVDTARATADLNLAAPLTDGDRVRVPSRDDPSPAAGSGGGGDASGTGGAGGAGTDPGGSGGSSPGSGRLIDLNRATATELDTLPGIGPVLAGRIIASREEAPFQSVAELRERGILGEATFAKVRDLVAVP